MIFKGLVCLWSVIKYPHIKIVAREISTPFYLRIIVPSYSFYNLSSWSWLQQKINKFRRLYVMWRKMQQAWYPNFYILRQYFASKFKIIYRSHRNNHLAKNSNYLIILLQMWRSLNPRKNRGKMLFQKKYLVSCVGSLWRKIISQCIWFFCIPLQEWK